MSGTLGKPCARSAFIQQVERLVREKSICQIPARKLHCRDDRLLRDADAVVCLEPRPQTEKHPLRLRL